MPGAVSALLGGLVNVIAGLVYAVMASCSNAKSPGQALRAFIRAEVSKLALIALQLGLVLTAYRDVVVPVFLTAFIISVLVFPMVLLVRN